MQNYSDSFREIRLDKNLTLMQVEKATGISNANLSRWENGQAIPGINFCIQLAQYYDVTLDELVGRTPDTSYQRTPTAIGKTELSPELVKLSKDKDFTDAAKLYLALDEIKRLQVISYIAGIAQGAGLNIQQILNKR